MQVGTGVPGETSSGSTWKMVLGAIGVVYGDIGTSPLYALKESLHSGHGFPLTDPNVIGVVSLFFWALTLVVAVKYLSAILTADNQGEGGITALLALLVPRSRKDQHFRDPHKIVLLGLFGAGLLYGDGIITPAISVLSAVEGLSVATPAFEHWVLPITVSILGGLFWVQSRGTARIGSVFGPLIVLWFLCLAATGLPWIIRRPEILQAVDPRMAIGFFLRNGLSSFFILSSVILCVTGAEALYADLGHFGKRPIRLGWYAVAFPGLLLNYFGQGALVLERGQVAADNPFYGLVGGWFIYPLVAIATMATVIASQALITGAFSLSQQIVHLGYFPRLKILHTSRSTEGQIYVPLVNLFLAVASICVVLFFKSSSNLAAAYGIAVNATMTITTVLFFLVARYLWKWNLWKACAVLLVFLLVDLAFFFANLSKLVEGGWFPVLIACVAVILMTTWQKGRERLAWLMGRETKPLEEFFQRIDGDRPLRIERIGVFLTLNRNVTPAALLLHYQHNKSLHREVVLLSIIGASTPEVPVSDRVRVTHLSHGFVKVVAMYGYMESPCIAEIFDACDQQGFRVDRSKISFYLGRESFVMKSGFNPLAWRNRLFAFMSRNARPASDYFGLPADQVIEIGTQIRLDPERK